MSESIRSFLAFDLENDQVRRKLAHVQKLLVQTGADLKPVEVENIHVTMRFLGNVTPKMVEAVFEEMKKTQFVPFNVQIRGLGAFPDVRYPRVVWAGITEGATELRGIFSQVEPRLRGLGFAPDEKGFSPHLTIARVRSGKNKAQLSAFVAENANYDFGTIRAECLRLKQSVLSPKDQLTPRLRNSVHGND